MTHVIMEHTAGTQIHTPKSNTHTHTHTHTHAHTHTKAHTHPTHKHKLQTSIYLLRTSIVT
jgi:hypothetical protein